MLDGEASAATNPVAGVFGVVGEVCAAAFGAHDPGVCRLGYEGG
jgi:hypothetical protein